MGGKSLHFLDLFTTIVNNKLETTICSKPTDSHVYLNARSSHPKSQIRAIAKGVALGLRCICSEDSDFYVMYTLNTLLIVAIIVPMSIEYLRRLGNMTRDEARKSKPKPKGNKCVFVTKYNPRVRDIASIIREHRVIIDTDERASEILPKNSLRVAYSRGPI